MSNFIDLTGQRFGKLVAISRVPGPTTKWNCICDCGKKALINMRSLKTGHTKSCGCLFRKDLTGQKFGRLTVISRADSKNNKPMWNCLCSCGKKCKVCGHPLKSGNTKSCGCLFKEKKLESNSSRLINLMGQKFGRLLVISHEGGGKWNCICDCGNKITIFSGNLRSNGTQSCGCLRGYSDPTLSSKHAIYYRYKREAKKRGLPFELSFEQLIELTQRNCYYCGKSPSQYKNHPGVRKGYLYNGIDRLDNKKGYILSNVVCSCKGCNRLKWDRNENDFLKWLKKCYLRPVLQPKKVLCANKKEGRAFSSEYALYNVYKRSCAMRGYSFDLNFEEFFYLTQQNCSYCGTPPSKFYNPLNHRGFCYNGIDRVDNNLGYTKNNSTSSCKDCNSAKMNLTVEEFFSRIKKCYEHLHSKGEL